MPANDLGREKIPQWPSLPSKIRAVVEQFYELVDTHSEKAYQGWSQLFTTDGVVEIGQKIRTGREELRNERRSSWNLIQHRYHTVYRVYTMDSDGSDVIVIGNVDIVTRKGVRFSQEFAQNFLITEEGGQYRIRKFQAWLDSAVLANALSENGCAEAVVGRTTGVTHENL